MKADDGNKLEAVEFNVGDSLFREGEKSFHFYIIRRGEVEVYKRSSEGKKLPIATVEEGQSIGELAMLDHQPRSASARALTKVSAILVSEDAYRELLDDLPEWARAMLESLADRLRKTNDIIKKNTNNDLALRLDVASCEFKTDTNTSITADSLSRINRLDEE